MPYLSQNKPDGCSYIPCHNLVTAKYYVTEYLLGNEIPNPGNEGEGNWYVCFPN